jgi:virulence factor
MTTPRRIALIGAGSIAWDVYLEDLARRPEVALAAVVARSPDTLHRVGSTYRVGEQFQSVEELLAFGDFDQAFVLTPPEAHHHQVVALLRAGHDVLCEKPVAPFLAQVLDLEEVQQETGRVLAFAFNRRYCPVYVRAKAAFAGRRPDVCIVQKNKEAPQRRALLHDAIHVVDTMRWFCGGEVEDVQARALGEDPHHETNVTASVRFSSGALGVLVMSRTAGQWHERLEAHGSNRTTVVDYPESVRVVNEETLTWQATPDGWGVTSAAARLGFSGLIDHFFDCVASRERPLTSIQEALGTHALVDAIYQAAGLPGLEAPEAGGH